MLRMRLPLLFFLAILAACGDGESKGSGGKRGAEAPRIPRVRAYRLDDELGEADFVVREIQEQVRETSAR